MKSIKLVQSCSQEVRRRSRSLQASHYYQECSENKPRNRQSQASVAIPDTLERQRKKMFHQKTKTMLIDNFPKPKKHSSPRKHKQIMYDSKQQQRRLSCCCQECGKQSLKMNKFHNIQKEQEKPAVEFWQSLNLRQQQSLLTISTKSLKSTATMVSLPEMSPTKLTQKVESPRRQKRIKQNVKQFPSPSITLTPYLYEPPQSKMINLLTEQSTNQPPPQFNNNWMIKPVQLRASAPNLETYEHSSKNISPRRGISNSNIRQESHILTQRIMAKKIMQTCYLKKFTGINIRQNIMSTQRIRDKLFK